MLPVLQVVSRIVQVECPFHGWQNDGEMEHCTKILIINWVILIDRMTIDI